LQVIAACLNFFPDETRIPLRCIRATIDRCHSAPYENFVHFGAAILQNLRSLHKFFDVPKPRGRVSTRPYKSLFFATFAFFAVNPPHPNLLSM
jgi:hypothetical protein